MSVDRSSVGRSVGRTLLFGDINFDFLDDIFSGGGSYSIAGMYNNAS